MNMNMGKLREMVRDRKAWRAAVHGGRKELDTTERLNKNNALDGKTHNKFIPVVV